MVKDLTGKTFVGYVLDKKDPAGMNRYAVYIPELMSNNIPGSKYVFLKNGINTFVKTRNPFSTNKEYISYGSYTPLIPGTKVLIEFLRNDINSGIIIGTDADVKTPVNQEKAQDYHLIYKSPKGSEIYIDEHKNIMHLRHNKGKSNIYLSDDEIIFQISEINASKGGLERASSLILSKEGLKITIDEDIVYQFDKSGFNLSLGKDTASIFQITKDGINIIGNKFVNIASESGKIHLSGAESFITGYNELHLFGNDTRLTGTQKCQVSGTTINIQGWYDTHIKAMHVGIEAYLMFNQKSLISNYFNAGLKNEYSTIDNTSSMVSTTSTNVYSLSSSIQLTDGFILSNMGLGSSVSSSVSTSMSSLTTSIETGMAIGGTMLLNNDAFTGAATNILTQSIAGSAAQAIGTINSFTAIAENIQDSISNLNNNLNIQEERSKKYIDYDKIFI